MAPSTQPPSPTPGGPDTIVLVHGLWMTPLCWEHWIARYAGLGYEVIARGWPGIGDDIEAFRRDPSAAADLTVKQIVEHYEGIVRALERPPVIIGHSFGGLFTQILLDRGHGAAGVAIDSAPPKGILNLPFSTLKVSFPALSNPANLHKLGALDPEQFHYAFCNTMTAEESLAVWRRYAVPGPDHVLFQAGLANFHPHADTAVNFRNDDRAPLLLIAGGKDHISPASLTHDNYALYAHAKAVTEYKEYPERSHYTLGQPGWEEVADFALDWAVRHARMTERA